ncbi:ATP-binding protein [Streptomyces zagrosensis]|uniref:Putative ATPase n=1 Tax=Streptomyces zagrosensis TaxID=1042984 RepID=A0A7W9V036_9ACTN|nr:regulator [Streptomyces zagrosensis]MBB5937725.1 putative ATPase [Streptomyces zagrosensis]
MVGHIPEETTSFVGREAELARLAGALSDDRLVTLTGAGGVGKSRLALRAAARAAPRYPDGVWWADLSPLKGDRLLLATVSDAVDLSDHMPGIPVEELCEWLVEKRLLLVLDSCEHLVQPCRHLLGDLLTTAPGLTLLATSRQPLELPGERVIEVGPLRADGPDALDLFTQRAKAASPGLSFPRPGAQTVSAVALCQRLEGIPLALELAAAQLGLHTFEELLHRLGSRFDVLEHPERVWPQRHQTLRTAIGWSHGLCTPAERLLWARLAVFRGAFDTASVRAVCVDGQLPAHAVQPALDGLLVKSVLGRSGDGYHMLDTVREYGREWLRATGEEAELADRHAEHFLSLTRQADAGWLSTDQVRWYGRISRAREDLCAALEHLLAARPLRALELAGLVGYFWSCCGHLTDARSFLERALALCPEPGPERTRGLWALGVALTLQGECTTARELSDQCAYAAQDSSDDESRLAAAYLAGLVSLLSGEPLAARALTGNALSTIPGQPFDSASRLRCHLAHVFALTALGRLSEARTEALRLRRGCAEIGEYWTRAYVEHQLALIALLSDRPREAAEHARAMLSGKQQMGDSFGIALGLDLLAAAIAAQGDGVGAALVYGLGQAYWRTVGHAEQGTPEVRAVRDEFERAARAAAGDLAYEAAFERGANADTQAALAATLAAGG